MPAGRHKKAEKEPAAAPRVKVVGMLPFDEAAVALGLTKKALRERLDAGVIASARIGDDTYVLHQAPVGEGATGRMASTLAPVAAAAAPATPPPTGTYGEQVDAQIKRAIALVENAEGDWGLFSQFLQPEWKPLPDVIYHHLRLETAAEVEEYDVALAIPSRAIDALRAIKAKFGSRAEGQREAEYEGEYQDRGYALPSRYESMPITPLTPSPPFTQEQQRVLEERHRSTVSSPFGRPPLDERVEEFLPACVKWERAWEDVHTGLVHEIGDDANYQFRVRDASLRVAEKALALVKRLDDIPQEPALPTGSVREQKELQ